MGLAHRKRSHTASHVARDLQSRPLQTVATETTLLGYNGLFSKTSATSGRFYRRMEVEILFLFSALSDLL